MSKRIFLVDDSATILLSISNILTKAGFEIEKAANAEEALHGERCQTQAVTLTAAWIDTTMWRKHQTVRKQAVHSTSPHGGAVDAGQGFSSQSKTSSLIGRLGNRRITESVASVQSQFMSAAPGHSAMVWPCLEYLRQRLLFSGLSLQCKQTLVVL